MKYIFTNEPNTKINTIKELNSHKRCNRISNKLYQEALELLYKDFRIRYYTSFDTIVKIEIVK
jgi:hypothetical protein